MTDRTFASRGTDPTPRAAWGTALYRPATFVVHRHLTASDDHFDVRLQVGRRVVTWLVRKGPAMDPRTPRIATRLPDAPSLALLGFEGVHDPKDGVSASIIWDCGTYQLSREPHRPPMSVADRLALGRLAFELSGERLVGGFTLIRVPHRRTSWLLVKRYDEGAQRAEQLDLAAPSVRSGRTIDMILGEGSTRFAG